MNFSFIKGVVMKRLGKCAVLFVPYVIDMSSLLIYTLFVCLSSMNASGARSGKVNKVDLLLCFIDTEIEFYHRALLLSFCSFLFLKAVLFTAT